jgi:hypothetical protein
MALHLAVPKMTDAILAALILFNTTVTEVRPVLAPNARVFVGVQPGEGNGGYARTRCVPESSVFVIQVAPETLKLSPPEVKAAAIHEACHVKIHGELLCNLARTPGAVLTPATQKGMEIEANACAVEYGAAR